MTNRYRILKIYGVMNGADLSVPEYNRYHELVTLLNEAELRGFNKAKERVINLLDDETETGEFYSRKIESMQPDLEGEK